MLDVHAPEHEIDDLRAFLVHLFTITIGLLIALGLEAGAEAVHHRHQREEAETLIRHEIQANFDALHRGGPGAVAEVKQMTNLLATLEARAKSQPGVLNQQDLVFHEAPMQDAAWRTASSTGALSYMDYDEVERFSDAYKEQTLLQTMEEQALDDYLQLQAILAHHGSEGVVDPDAARDAIPFARRVIAHLNGMLDVGAGTAGTYEEALKGKSN